MSNPGSVQSKFVMVNGKKIHYLEAGEGSPLILIHGWLASSNVFHKIIPELSKKFHVLVPDLPGYGLKDVSQELDSEHTLAAYVDFLRAFVKEMKLQRVNLVGLSMGGTISLEWAKRFPQEIEKIAVFEPVLGKEDISGLARNLSKVAYTVKSLRRFIRWLIVQGAKREKFITKLSVQDQKAVLGEIYGGELRAAAESAHDLLKGVDIKSYKGIQAPVLLVAGGFQTSISSPHSIEKLAQVLPHVRVEKFASGSHNLVREEGGAPAFAKVLIDFFS